MTNVDLTYWPPTFRYWDFSVENQQLLFGDRNPAYEVVLVWPDVALPEADDLLEVPLDAGGAKANLRVIAAYPAIALLAGIIVPIVVASIEPPEPSELPPPQVMLRDADGKWRAA